MQEDTKSLEEHLEEFKTVGFTLFPKMLDDSWVKAMRDSFEEIGDRLPNPDGSRPQVFVDVLEHKPDLVLSALSNKRLLDFAEMIVGPHVQLESITYRRTAPQDPDTNPVLGFHRDMFAEFPQEGIYHRPLLFNALSYLQDLDDEIGPLRIIPGSHMKAMALTPEERTTTPSRRGHCLSQIWRYRRISQCDRTLGNSQLLKGVSVSLFSHDESFLAQTQSQLFRPNFSSSQSASTSDWKPPTPAPLG